MKKGASRRPFHFIGIPSNSGLVEWVTVIGRRGQCLLDRPRADPAEEVEVGPCLVIGSRSSGTSERLLTNDCACWFVVDVKVAGGIFECAHGVIDGVAFTGKHGASEGVFTRGIYRLQDAVEVIGGVDVNRDDRPEDFFLHGFEVGVLGHDDRRFHEVSCAVVTHAPTQDVGIGALFGVVDVAFDVVEGPAVDDRADEVRGVSRGAHFECAHFGGQFLLDLRPKVVWQVHAARSAAFLSLEFERAANDAGDHLVHVGGTVGDDEILAASFTDNARIRLVLGNVLADGLPQVTENTRAACEMQSGKVRVGEHDITCGRTVDGHEVDDALRQAGSVQQLHDNMGGVNLVVRGLPHDHIAHEGGSDRQVACNGCEVEWCDRKDETFQSAVFESIPKAWTAFGLLRVNLLGEVAVEPEEVDELAGSVDFGLMEVLALGQHRGRIDAGAPRAGEHLCSAQENAGTLLPLQGGPGGTGFEGAIDCILDVFGGAEMGVPDDALVVVWRAQGPLVFSEDSLTANHHGDGDGVLIEHALVFGKLGLTFGAAGAVSEDGFIFRVRNLEEGVGHGVSLWPQM